MDNWKSRLKRRLFGLHPVKTIKYIWKLKHFQEQETNEWIERLLTKKKAVEVLRQEVVKLEEQISSSQKRNEQYEVANSRLTESKKVLRMLGEYEANAIREKMAREEKGHIRRLELMENQRQSYEETFHSLLTEFSELILKIEQTDTSIPATDSVENEEVSYLEVAVSKVQAQREDVMEDTEQEQPTPSLLDLEEQELAVIQGRAKVIQFKLRTIVERQMEVEERLQDQDEEDKHIQVKEQKQEVEQAQEVEQTQEGALEREARQEIAMDADREEIQVQDLAAASSWGSIGSAISVRPNSRKQEKKRTSKLSPQASAFWGEINDYLNVSKETPETEEFDAVIEVVQEEIFAGRAETTSETAERSSTVPVIQPKQQAAQESPTLSSEIAAIRNRYIVGKLAGEALHGHDGRLIIGKNQRISARVVQDADQEGKLSDLIIHMIIPAMNEGGEE